jgi:4-diphosphocytidyl-2-C-methyl-D-erythritol kinase
VQVLCPAKLNLFLEVLGRRPDGYHEIDSVLVAVSPYDIVSAARREAPGVGLNLAGETAGVPADATNLAARAAAAILAGAGEGAGGLDLALFKVLPPGAGLGGGSSDAAGALLAAALALGVSPALPHLEALAAGLGSDVPFFLRGGAARARGRGERLEPLPHPPALRFLVSFPGVPCATAEVYRACMPAPPGERRDPAEVMDALARGDAAALDRACFNRLEAPARAACPALREEAQALRTLGAGRVHMTGSGSALFLVLPPGADAEALLRRLPPGRPERRAFAAEVVPARGPRAR